MKRRVITRCAGKLTILSRGGGVSESKRLDGRIINCLFGPNLWSRKRKARLQQDTGTDSGVSQVLKNDKAPSRARALGKARCALKGTAAEAAFREFI